MTDKIKQLIERLRACKGFVSLSTEEAEFVASILENASQPKDSEQ